MDTINLILLTILSGLSVAAFLGWWFDGEFSAKFCARVFPEKWLDGTSRYDVAFDVDWTEWVTQNMKIPDLVAQLVTCKFCMSAHFSWMSVGVIYALMCLSGACGFDPINLWILPALIPAAAAVGIFIHNKFS